MRDLMEEGYIPVSVPDLKNGDEIIVEHKRYDYKTGKPVESEFFRTIAGEHSTVSGPAKHLVSEPSVEWPQLPQWQLGWIYASNDMSTQMWKKEGEQ